MLALIKIDTLTSLIRPLCFIALSALIHLLIFLALPSPSPTHPIQQKGLLVTILQSAPQRTASPRLPPSPKTTPRPLPSSIKIGKATTQPKRYYEISELDKPIGPLSKIAPQYPPQAQISGKIILDLYLDEFGIVQSVLAHESTLSEDYNQAAIMAFMNKNFEPGTVKTLPVKVHLRISLEFVPETYSVGTQ